MLKRKLARTLCRTLCVSNCLQVTDKGIEYFCGIKETNVAVCCRGLENLLIRGTSVTPKGVSHALIHLRNVKIVDYDEKHPGIVCPETFMTSFSCDDEGSIVIETIIMLPPHGFLRCTRIEKKVYSNQLANMIDLSSRLCPVDENVDPRMSFDLGIVPFLARFGRSLLNLSLHRLNGVNIFLISTSCPHLKSIKLKSCSFVPLGAQNIPMSFIEEIEFDGTNGRQITRRGLFHLFLSPNLTNISIVHAIYLSDHMLNFAFCKHRFQHLKRLKLFGCGNISNEAFKSTFLVESNALRSIKIWGCLQLSLPNVRDEWNELVSKKNFDVDIVFL